MLRSPTIFSGTVGSSSMCSLRLPSSVASASAFSLKSRSTVSGTSFSNYGNSPTMITDQRPTVTVYAITQLEWGCRCSAVCVMTSNRPDSPSKIPPSGCVDRSERAVSRSCCHINSTWLPRWYYLESNGLRFDISLVAYIVRMVTALIDKRHSCRISMRLALRVITFIVRHSSGRDDNQTVTGV